MKISQEKLMQIVREETAKALKEQKKYLTEQGGAKCLLPNLEEVPMRKAFKWEDGKWYRATMRCSQRKAYGAGGERCNTGLPGAWKTHIESWATSPEVGKDGDKYLRTFGPRRVGDTYVGGTWVDTGPRQFDRQRHGIKKHARSAYCMAAKPAEKPEEEGRGMGRRGRRFCKLCRQVCGEEEGHPPARSGIERVHGSPGVGSGRDPGR